jgi:hypothetical protein
MRGIGTAAGAGARDAATTGAEEAGGSRATAAGFAAGREGEGRAERVRAAKGDSGERAVSAGDAFRTGAAEGVRRGPASAASRNVTEISAACRATGRHAVSRVRGWT